MGDTVSTSTPEMADKMVDIMMTHLRLRIRRAMKSADEEYHYLLANSDSTPEDAIRSRSLRAIFDALRIWDETPCQSTPDTPQPQPVPSPCASCDRVALPDEPTPTQVSSAMIEYMRSWLLLKSEVRETPEGIVCCWYRAWRHVLAGEGKQP